MTTHSTQNNIHNPLGIAFGIMNVILLTVYNIAQVWFICFSDVKCNKASIGRTRALQHIFLVIKIVYSVILHCV